MLEQASHSITWYWFFTSSKTGKTALTPKVDAYKGSNGSSIVSSGSATEIGGGYYKYTLGTSGTSGNDDYIAVARTTDATVDAQWLPSMWAVGRAGVNNLDALVSSRSTGFQTLVTLNPVGTTGDISLVRGDSYSLSDGASRTFGFNDASGNVWPDLTNAQSILFTVKDYSDVTVLQVAASSYVTVASGAGKRVDIDLASSQTNLFSPGVPAYQFDIAAVLSSTAGGHKATLAVGALTIIEDVTTS